MTLRKSAWLCIACVALGCSARHTADASPKAATEKQTAGAPGAAGAQAESSTAGAAGAAGSAGVAGAAGAVAAAGSGGQPSAGHAAVDCDALRQAIKDALGAFKPTSPNTCTSDADCKIIPSVIYRSPAVCLDGCGIPVASAYGDQYAEFSQNDPGVTATCNAALQAGCGLPSHSCPCSIYDPELKRCRAPRCVDGACK